jgi:hypothetical protein
MLFMKGFLREIIIKNLKTAKVILLLFLIFNLPIIIPAQRGKTRRSNKSVRILNDKPTVYITFENFGERKSDGIGESDKIVYLRLHNNTRWSLVLLAQGASDKSLTTGKDEEVGLFYGVEEVQMSNTYGIIPDIPPQPRMPPQLTDEEIKADLEASKYEYCEVPSSKFCHFCSVIRLSPGKSLLFSLPRETLCGNLKTYIAYQYDWENDWGFGNEPEHRVYFYGSELSKKKPKK